MGGRKPASVKRVLGNLSHSVTERKHLGEALTKEIPSQIAVSTLNTIRKSTNAISNLSNAIRMLDLFSEGDTPGLSTADARKKATKYWESIKKEREIPPNLDTDRVLISQAARILKMGGSK